MRALWRTRRSFAARGHCNRFGWRSLGFRKMGEPGAFSSGGWHVPKSGQSFESPATPLTNYCCCCSETKKKEKRETRENRMEQPLTLNSTDRWTLFVGDAVSGSSSVCADWTMERVAWGSLALRVLR